MCIRDSFIINTSDDSFVFGLDVDTGELVWENKIFDYQVTPVGHSSGPIIADGRVISGRSCRPQGGPESCVILAHDARTGEELWRRRTVPAPGEPGDETWGGVPYERRVHVGTWMPPSPLHLPSTTFTGCPNKCAAASVLGGCLLYTSPSPRD